MVAKTRFASGVIITADFLDAIQDSIRFTGLNRNSIGNEPTEDDELFWEINQRDGLYDWELNTESRLRSYLEMGSIVNITNLDGFLTGNALSLEYDDILYDPDINLEILEKDDFYYIGIRAGYSVSGNEKFEWSDTALAMDKTSFDAEFVTNGSVSIYVYIVDGEVSYRFGSFPPTGIVPLWIINRVSFSFSIPQPLIEDYRPHIGMSESKNPFVAFDETTYSTNIQLISGKSYAGDTSNFGLVWTMPINPQNGDFVGVFDRESSFFTNNLVLTIDSTESSTFMNGETSLTLNILGGYYEFTYFEPDDVWILTNTNVTDLTRNGNFVSCGGDVEFLGPSVLCVDGTRVLEFADETLDPVYWVDPSDSKCYKRYPDTVGIYIGDVFVGGDNRCIKDTVITVRDPDNKFVEIPAVVPEFNLTANYSHILINGTGDKILNLPFDALNGDVIIILRYNDPPGGVEVYVQVTNPAHQITGFGVQADITTSTDVKLVFWNNRWLYHN